jgi:prepilin-type N-terminal cleavage/methylation domain-containing protein
MHSACKQKAFTLLELLVVITIIGILSSIVVVSMSGGTESAEIAKGKSYAQQVHALLGHELKGEWAFDEGGYNTCSGSYDVCDTSEYGHHGTIYSDGARYVSSPFGEYTLYFDGIDDYVTLGNVMDGFTDFSLTVWASTTQEETGIAVYARPTIIGVVHGSGYTTNDFTLGVYNGNLDWWDEFNGVYQADHNTGYSISDGAWHFIVASREISGSNSLIRLYLDGILVGSYTSAGIGAISRSIRVGFGYTGSEFDGFLDEVRIYSTALDVSVVQKYYAQGLDRFFKSDAITREEYIQRMGGFNESLIASSF